jgi:hypothetical protein
MNFITDLFVNAGIAILLVLIITFATGLASGNLERGKALVAWELKKLWQFTRWSLRFALQATEHLCKWLRTKL